MKRIHIGFSFLLFNAFLFMFCDGIMILSFYFVCLIHEMGHLVALKATGGELRRIELSFFGIRMVAAPASDLRCGAIVLLSGPAMNFITYMMLKVLDVGVRTAELSLAACLFNLMPFSSLDGGALLEMYASGRPYERRANQILTLLRAGTVAVIMAIIIMRIND